MLTVVERVARDEVGLVLGPLRHVHLVADERRVAALEHGGIARDDVLVVHLHAIRLRVDCAKRGKGERQRETLD